jgi:hypothetical protein
MPITKRTPQDAAADRTLMTGLVTDLRDARRDLRTAIKALPAPASRTAAQKRDATIMRAVCVLIQAQLAQLGVAGPADRDVTEA